MKKTNNKKPNKITYSEIKLNELFYYDYDYELDWEPLSEDLSFYGVKTGDDEYSVLRRYDIVDGKRVGVSAYFPRMSFSSHFSSENKAFEIVKLPLEDK